MTYFIKDPQTTGFSSFVHCWTSKTHDDSSCTMKGYGPPNVDVIAGRLRRSSLRQLFCTLVVGAGFVLLVTTVFLHSVSSPGQHVAVRNRLGRREMMMRGPHSHYDDNDEDEEDGPETDNVGGHRSDEDFHRGESEVAQEMARKVRVLCWVLTGPQNHQKKARHVKATWGRRFNILLFMSSANDSSLPTVVLDVGEGRENLWGKTKRAFTYVYNNYRDQADWFMKADDDTYVIVENLRLLLSTKNSSEPIYFGCRFNKFMNQGYMSGGAGYVLSKEALRRFVDIALPDEKICKQSDGGPEDVEIGKCLENVGVKAGDSRDQHGRKRFFPLPPDVHLTQKYNSEHWYFQYILYPDREGMDCCSDSAISFHYVSPNMMYLLEYLIYHLHPYGISRYSSPPSDPPLITLTSESPTTITSAASTTSTTTSTTSTTTTTTTEPPSSTPQATSTSIQPPEPTTTAPTLSVESSEFPRRFHILPPRLRMQMIERPKKPRLSRKKFRNKVGKRESTLDPSLPRVQVEETRHSSCMVKDDDNVIPTEYRFHRNKRLYIIS